MKNNSAQVMTSESTVFDVNLSEDSFIQFLTFRITKENGQDKIVLLESYVRPGRLKKKIDISINHHSPEPDIICAILDGESKVTHEKSMPYPLVRSFEYTEEDGKQINRKNVTLESADILIRIPFKESNKFIRFEKSVNAIERIEMGSLKIN